jgi:hypothetical protein
MIASTHTLHPGQLIPFVVLLLEFVGYTLLLTLFTFKVRKGLSLPDFPPG